MGGVTCVPDFLSEPGLIFGTVCSEGAAFEVACVPIPRTKLGVIGCFGSGAADPFDLLALLVDACVPMRDSCARTSSVA